MRLSQKGGPSPVLVVETDEVSVRTYVAGRAAQAGETRHEEKQASQG